MRRLFVFLVFCGTIYCGAGCFCRASEAPAAWDTLSDTWVATDGLGRSLPTAAEVGPPRPHKFVAVFYFLWHGRHGEAGPFDVTKILATDSNAMAKPDSPLWGPLYVPHHWGESIFGYYVSDDEGVIRKHAQMLADAGVDAVVFDVTNGLTYPESYTALMRAFAEVRGSGGRVPQIAFLCPFGDPRKVLTDLWTHVYQPALQPELWFRWQGKPLILADPEYFKGDFEGEVEFAVKRTTPARLEPRHSLGQVFRAEKSFSRVAGSFPTWATSNAGMTLTLFRDGPSGVRIASRHAEQILDNAWVELKFENPLPAGHYYLEASSASGTIGWWSDSTSSIPDGQAMADDRAVPGSRTLRIGESGTRNQLIRNFFTFRKPQPDYFQGPTKPDMWSWLEIFPQHVFTNSTGEKEMMSVGVAQNAVGHRLGSMSEPEAKGRSFHHGATDHSTEAVRHGFNFAEQWERALAEDPQLIFITGWNEWIAGRFDEFNHVKLPVMFVDQFDEEHSRDIEPMRGGHGDDYYYQLIANIRRFKGARALPLVRSRPIRIDGQFGDWNAVEPEFRDQIGDPMRRENRGWGQTSRYEDHTGRNDIVTAKVSADAENVYFYVRTREALTPCTDPNWMLLYLDVDQNPTNGWLGYDFVVNRTGVTPRGTTLERHQGNGYNWGAPTKVDSRMSGNELELAIPRSALGITTRSAILDFKWADNIQQSGDWSDFTLHGDVAPNDRFNYRAKLEDVGAK